MLDHDEIVRLYGPWLSRTPEDAAELFAGYPGPWWVAGGWAIEAFTGRHRPHGDLDPSIPRADLPLLLDHLAGRLDVWAADNGTLRPLLHREGVADECENVWLRATGGEPWQFDVILMHTTPERWTFKRDHRIGLPFEQILWRRDGITYLRPEIQLLHKARGLRPQDQADFDSCAPLLPEDARAWLREALGLAHPGHPWLAAL